MAGKDDPMEQVQKGKLVASNWAIPRYGQGLLWLESRSGLVQPKGEHGLFTLETFTPNLVLRWGKQDGPALAHLPYREETLGWDGAVRIGGYIDALYMTEIPGLDFPIMLVYLGGQPLKHHHNPYPAAAMRTQTPFPTPDFYVGLAAEVPETITTWLVAEHSPLSTLAHDAMVNNLRLYCFGRLAEEAGGWHNYFALPILLEAIMVFAP